MSEATNKTTTHTYRCAHCGKYNSFDVTRRCKESQDESSFAAILFGIIIIGLTFCSIGIQAIYNRIDAIEKAVTTEQKKVMP